MKTRRRHAFRHLIPASLFTTFLAVALTTQASANTRVLLDQPQKMADLMLNDLSGARKRIDIVIPDLNDRVLFRELMTLAKSKKKIRVILSTAEDGVKSWKCVPCTDLEAEGIDIRFIDTAIHSRFAIIDGPRTRFSSGRFGKVLTFKGRVATGEGDQLIRITKSGDYVLSYQDEFNHLWSKASDYGDPARGRKSSQVRVPSVPGVFFTSANMIPVSTPTGWLFTPSLDQQHGVIENFVEGAVNYAYKTIDVSTDSIRNPLLYQALVKAKGRGVKVRVIVDRNEFSGGIQAGQCDMRVIAKEPLNIDECLAAKGIPVIYRTGGKKSPDGAAGYILIDRKLVLTGPVSSEGNHEFSAIDHLIVIRDTAHDVYARNFTKQMTLAIPVHKKTARFTGK